MILVKIISIFFATSAGLCQICLEYKWHDKRTKKHKAIRSLLIFIMILGFLTASLLTIYDDRQVNNQISKLEELKKSAEDATLDAVKRESKAVEERTKIQNELIQLKDEIKPIVELAMKKYPELNLTDAIAKLKEDVENLQRVPEYGLVAKYCFSGLELQGRTLYPFTPVANWSDGYLRIENNIYHFTCSEDSLKHYKKIIEKEPKFPFPYIAVAQCLYSRNDPEWRTWAEKAESILEITTQVHTRSIDHDRWLVQIKKLLDPSLENSVIKKGK